MPDGSSRFARGGEPLFHYMGCSSFSNFTVLPEIAVAAAYERATDWFSRYPPGGE
jgi:S-(hydroxymethyl)glutathione dehydrogenase/alcohol dehydrogenase